MTLDTSFNPNTAFGGTWERDKGGFIYADYSECTSGYRGTGHQTVSTTLTVDQIPSHMHLGLYDNTNGAERYQSYGTGDTHKAYIGGMGTVPWNEHFRTGYSGGGQGHYHQMPWIGVFLWKRTA